MESIPVRFLMRSMHFTSGLFQARLSRLAVDGTDDLVGRVGVEAVHMTLHHARAASQVCGWLCGYMFYMYVITASLTLTLYTLISSLYCA